MDEQDRKLHESQMKYALAALLIAGATIVAVTALLAGKTTSVGLGVTVSISAVFSVAGVGSLWKMWRQRTDLQRGREARERLESINRRLDDDVHDLETENRQLQLDLARLQERRNIADEQTNAPGSKEG